MIKVKGLYRGASSSFVGMAFESSLFFGMYSQMKKSLQVTRRDEINEFFSPFEDFRINEFIFF